MKLTSLTPEQSKDLLDFIDEEEQRIVEREAELAAEQLRKQIEANHAKNKKQAEERAARNAGAKRNYNLRTKPRK